MKYILLTISFLLCYSYGNSQTLIWSDDFETTASDWNLTILSGTNDANANLWKISDEEGGVTPPGCGVAGNGDKTLHITCQGPVCIGTGAIYFAGDGGGLGFPGATDKRAALINPINTTSQVNLEFVFDWIGVGQAGQDFAEFEYSIDGGATWVPIWTQTPGNTCSPGGQGEWKEETVSLPVATENIADLRFAFHWINDNDGAGTDPSFAVNDLRLYANNPTTPPIVDFTTPNFTICENDCIDFTDASTGSNISSWNWTFDGSSTASSTSQNPTNICFPMAGIYDVTLEVTDDNGTDSKTLQVTVNSCTNPTADFTTPNFTICENDCIDFTDASTGTNISSWNWTFDGSSTASSTNQNPTNICFPTAGTYDVTLEVTDDNGTGTKTLQVSVNDCSHPTADFTTPTFTVCIGDCIDFTDASTGTNISSWDWTFNGADTPTSSNQNPTNICYSAAGIYNVRLKVTDDNGTDTKTLQVVVDDCASAPTASFLIDSSTVCEGDCISFTDLSLGTPTSWQWTFTGGTPSTSTQQNPSNICFNSSGVYGVTLTVTNSYGTDQIVTPVNVLDLPIIYGYGDTIIDMGGSAELEAVPIDVGNVFWDPNESLDCSTCLTVIASPLITTTYYPSLIGSNGCIGRDTVTVTVNFEEIVEVPSGFSPNGDGVNDSIHVLGVGIVSINLNIYNRYGQLVFSTTDIEEGWDGTMNGKPLNQGVFAYTLEYELVNGARGKKSGNITLVK